MTIEEIRQAYWNEEVLEYHLTGREQDASLLPGPGWYSCIIDCVEDNGNVEISFTRQGLEHMGATVLKKNIPIAFRRKQEATC